ncbi:metal-dependent hydrolase [Campylobacter sp. VBCF_06 NA8]|uniref:aminofutalosine deaminase family hydrolase n=1 Tax=Campylobacter sp. VBCF_06 NA8 TaxID=2983822 RepID=UPI0022E9E4DD|nr:metal-dependent hydrolase [Campylobacter sp. VBCF_06 NA8]MDA3046784.1 metal-dependent hydrolase [Campylobacter sp. VBCF_06 NA8]
MKILKAKWILTCDEKFKIHRDKAVVFDEKIEEILKPNEAREKYPEAEFIDCGSDIAMPAFINTHTHLEFSANRTHLIYGDFVKWVASIVNAREELSKQALETIIEKEILTMMKSGVATIGEISSFGTEAQICAKSPARFVFFNEILGADKNTIDANIDKFSERFTRSAELVSDLFIPAVSVHAPYSTHPEITKFATDFARDNELLMSSHFMESNHERDWLKHGKGAFKEWLGAFLPNPKPFYSPKSYIEYFKGVRTLFTHCVFADLKLFDKKLHSITHCAVSNRLLGRDRLKLTSVIKNGYLFSIGTDGLSSNISLNFLDELRANLFVHDGLELSKLARELLLGATNRAAKSLDLNLGELSSGKIADIAVFGGFECDESQLALQLILQSKNAKSLYIKGKKCNF